MSNKELSKMIQDAIAQGVQAAMKIQAPAAAALAPVSGGKLPLTPEKSAKPARPDTRTRIAVIGHDEQGRPITVGIHAQYGVQVMTPGADRLNQFIAKSPANFLTLEALMPHIMAYIRANYVCPPAPLEAIAAVDVADVVAAA